ncbi:MAG: cell division protein FtsW [Phycisphaerales bacterium]|nr:cell division protein FtsW [Phycisphaerales bacterium]
MLRPDVALVPVRPLHETGEPSRPLLTAGQGIALCVLALLTMGVVMVNSAGMSVDRTRAVTAESLLFSKSTIYMALAMAALALVAVLPIRRLTARWVERAPRTIQTTNGSWLTNQFRHWARLAPLWIFVACSIGLLSLVYVPVIGKEVNHSHRWINLHAPGLDSVQPSEIAKWTLIIAVAWYCCRNARNMASFWTGLLPGLAAAGAVSAFIVLEDLGTGALLGMVACILLIAGGARLWHLLVLAPLPMAAMAAAIVTSDYRTHRILAFLNPYEDPKGIGYHMIQSMVAVANGQFFGTGLGHGLQKFGYLPEDTTDFVFAIVCEELGVFGGALVVFLYGAMLWCILAIIRREPSRFLKLVALGVMATVAVQAIINLAVVTGLGPTKGIALPLLSSGGTGWILTAASLGLIIAMDRTHAQAAVSLADSEPGAAEPNADEPAADLHTSTPAEAPTAAAIGPFSLVPDDTRFAPLYESASLDQPAESPTFDLVSTVDARAASSQLLIGDDPGPSAGPAGVDQMPAPADSNLTQPQFSPTMDVAPGETGRLFGESIAAQPDQTPEVVITDQARDWPPPVSSHRIAET